MSQEELGGGGYRGILDTIPYNDNPFAGKEIVAVKKIVDILDCSGAEKGRVGSRGAELQSHPGLIRKTGRGQANRGGGGLI